MLAGTLIPSLTPNEDLDLLNGEYAALRPLTVRERRGLGLGRRSIGYAFVLRSCAGIQTILVPATVAAFPLAPDTLAAMLDRYAADNETGRPFSRSAGVMAIIVRLFPFAERELRAQRPTVGPCRGCQCMWQAKGAFGLRSIERTAVSTIVELGDRRDAA